MTESGYSLSDIAAVSGGRNDGMFGGDWSAWIILFLLFGLFGNGNGFGGYGEIVYGTKGTMIILKEEETQLLLKEETKASAGAGSIHEAVHFAAGLKAAGYPGIVQRAGRGSRLVHIGVEHIGGQENGVDALRFLEKFG